MPISMLLLESDTELTNEDFAKIKEYYDSSTEPTQVCKFIESIVEIPSTFLIFRLAKKLDIKEQTYKIEKDRIIPQEQPSKAWDDCYVYMKEKSKYIYIKGAKAGWASALLSEILFGVIGKIKVRSIDTALIEQDIRQNSKFVFTGTRFEDPDGTKITISNTAGMDLQTHWATREKEDTDKNYMGIVVEKDDLRINVKIYPDGKITIQGYVFDPITALRMFLKIWPEIQEYEIKHDDLKKQNPPLFDSTSNQSVEI